jgi:hypothetical protein
MRSQLGKVEVPDVLLLQGQDSAGEVVEPSDHGQHQHQCLAL